MNRTNRLTKPVKIVPCPNCGRAANKWRLLELPWKHDDKYCRRKSCRDVWDKKLHDHYDV